MSGFASIALAVPMSLSVSFGGRKGCYHTKMGRLGQGCGLAAKLLLQPRAAFETSKLCSSIWKRVTAPLSIVRMIANCVAVMLPVALIRVRSAPTIAARRSLARISSTSKTWDLSVRGYHE